ncbi:MAG: hypothetical protein ACRDH5_15470, partial [bacterium]
MRKLLSAFLLLAVTIAAQAPAEPEAEALREQARALLRQAAAVALEAEPRDRTKLLSDIASNQWKLGDHDAASKTFDLAQAALEIVQGDNEADPPYLRPLAVTAARVYAGDLDGAAKTLERIEDPAARKQAIEVLPWGRARSASTLEEAEAARALRDKEAGDRVAAGIVAKWAKEGNLEKPVLSQIRLPTRSIRDRLCWSWPPRRRKSAPRALSWIRKLLTFSVPCWR